MKLGLRLPNGFKLIQIVLSIENLIFQAVVWILIQLRHLVLTDCLMIEIEFLASVADVAQITACIVDLTIDFLEHDNQLLWRKFFR